jgi:hypothetical protein
VPDWILKLPKPSKLKRRQMGKVKRAEYVTPDARVGRADAIKKRCVPCGKSYVFLQRAHRSCLFQGHDCGIEASGRETATNQRRRVGWNQ